MPVRLPEDDDVLSVVESLMDELAVLHAPIGARSCPGSGRRHQPGDSPDAEEKVDGRRLVQLALDQFTDKLPPSSSGSVSSTSPAPMTSARVQQGRAHPHPRRLPHRQPVRRRWPNGVLRLGGRQPVPRACATSSTPSATPFRPRSAAARRTASSPATSPASPPEASSSMPPRPRSSIGSVSIYSWISATTTAAMGSKLQPADVGLARHAAHDPGDHRPRRPRPARRARRSADRAGPDQPSSEPAAPSCRACRAGLSGIASTKSTDFGAWTDALALLAPAR